VRAVNLIPADQRGGTPVGAGRSGGAVYAVLGLIAGVALLAVIYGVSRHQVSSRQAQIKTLSAKAAAAKAEAGELAPYTSFIALREARVHAVEQLVSERFDWAHVFHEFGRVLPLDASITQITGTIAGASGSSSTPAPAAPAAPASGSTASGSAGSSGSAASQASQVTSATPPGSVPTFTVNGCATSQSAVADTLARLRLMDGVSQVTLQSSTKPSASAGAGGSSAGCPPGVPVFVAQVTFEALPVASVPSSSTSPVADTAGAGSTEGGSSK
jgi:Tfp pilus assembly protein PilN